MRQLIRHCLVASLAITVLGLGVAHAEDDDVEENASGVGPFTKVNYPLEAIERPLTLVGGMLEAGGVFAIGKVAGADTATGLVVGAAYGLGNKIQIGVTTGLNITPDADLSKVLGLQLGYLALDHKNLDVRAGLSTGFNFNTGADVFSGFSIDASTRFKLNKMFALVAGDELIDIVIKPDSAVSANINVGVLAQIVPKLAVTLSTQLVHLKVTGDANATTHIGDAIPLEVEILFAVSRKLDVAALISIPALDGAGDNFTIGLGAAYRL